MLDLRIQALQEANELRRALFSTRAMLILYSLYLNIINGSSYIIHCEERVILCYPLRPFNSRESRSKKVRSKKKVVIPETSLAVSCKEWNWGSESCAPGFPP